MATPGAFWLLRALVIMKMEQTPHNTTTEEDKPNDTEGNEGPQHDDGFQLEGCALGPILFGWFAAREAVGADGSSSPRVRACLAVDARRR
jgi:hypothetical protein